MSERAARTHNHVSNRTKHRESGERKVVFKSVLDNPFRIQWYKFTSRFCSLFFDLQCFRPFVPMNVQNSILALTVAMMDGISDYHLSRCKEHRKRKREHRQTGPVQKKRRVDGEVMDYIEVTPVETQSFPANDIPPFSSTGTTDLEPPEILQHLTVGINEVTKRLESQIHHSRVTVVTTAGDPKITVPGLKIILVCRADIDPPLLIDHLPNLVAAYNSARPIDTIKLVPLPKGAESSLARVIGLRRAAVVGIDVC